MSLTKGALFWVLVVLILKNNIVHIRRGMFTAFYKIVNDFEQRGHPLYDLSPTLMKKLSYLKAEFGLAFY